MPKTNNNSYDADDITVLRGLEGVRKRPAMYIGDTDKKGLHHLVFEVLDNSVDEAIAGFCDEISVTLYRNNSVLISDNGRGIPIDEHPEFKKPALEVIMEHLHAGGKFDNKSYKISGGLHGVGLSVVNALTEWMEVEVCRDDLCYKQKFSRGKKVTDPEILEVKNKGSYTKISFYPDTTIFEFDPKDHIFNAHTITTRMRELAFLTPHTRFELHNKITDETEEFHFEGGIKEFITYLNKDKQPLHNDVIYITDTAKDDDGADIYFDVAMQYNQGFQTNILSYANTINTIEGGVHLTGFKSALTRVFNFYIENYMEKKYKGQVLSGTDTREGLSAVISIKLPDPQFESQTKIKLGNPEIRQIVSQIVTDRLTQYFEENPQTAKRIILKTLNAKMAREAAQKARMLIRRKSALDSARMP
ncbi:MAG: ATP-binding protein, partial [Candidatus Thorarchaeota archaeon]